MGKNSTASARDKRIDHVGFVGELDKQFAKPLRDAIKSRHAVGAQLTGDYFEGKIVASTSTTFPIEAWHKLFEKKDISKEEYLEGLRVSTDHARTTLAASVFEKHAKQGDGEPQLRITRKKGVELALLTAIKGIGDALQAPSDEPSDPLPMRTEAA